MAQRAVATTTPAIPPEMAAMTTARTQPPTETAAMICEAKEIDSPNRPAMYIAVTVRVANPARPTAAAEATSAGRTGVRERVSISVPPGVVLRVRRGVTDE